MNNAKNSLLPLLRLPTPLPVSVPIFLCLPLSLALFSPTLASELFLWQAIDRPIVFPINHRYSKHRTTVFSYSTLKRKYTGDADKQPYGAQPHMRNAHLLSRYISMGVYVCAFICVYRSIYYYQCLRACIRIIVLYTV